VIASQVTASSADLANFSPTL